MIGTVLVITGVIGTMWVLGKVQDARIADEFREMKALPETTYSWEKGRETALDLWNDPMGGREKVETIRRARRSQLCLHGALDVITAGHLPARGRWLDTDQGLVWLEPQATDEAKQFFEALDDAVDRME